MRPPIADPFGSSDSFAEESRIFRQSFWRTYRGALLFSVLFMVPLMGIFFWFAIPEVFLGRGRIMLAVVFGFMVLLNPLAGALGAVLHPIKVTRFGIQGPPTVGFIEWEQMKLVRTFWLGHPYARVSLRHHLFPLWILLALLDEDGFARTLQDWAPEDNPLRTWAQKRGV